MYDMVQNPKQVSGEETHINRANETPLKCLFKWQPDGPADGGPIGLLSTGWIRYPNIQKWGFLQWSTCNAYMYVFC